jgi:alkanesulfonate monooxygenase SsuD/methylene tetrahydromethanopterin reductase-like flavin-dependent oxidoreductase (luciferase family)
MEFALAIPARPDAWKDIAIAEDCGFAQAWFYDSQMLYSDVYVSMALAAEHTRHIKLGTGVAIPSNRIEPVTAHSIATINQMAPGRTILGLGTGFTGRNTMGLPAVPLAQLRAYVETVRGLLRGEEVMFREGARERAIRFLHRDHGYINLKDPIPIHIAADGPKALELTGEIGDGWMSVMSDAPGFARKFDAVRRGALRAGRSVDDMPTAILTTGCVLRDGETPTSPRVMARVGAFAVVFLHAMWESSANPEGLPPHLGDIWKRYRDDYVATIATPAEKRYLDMHEGHLIYMRPGEEKFVDDTLVQMMTLTGHADEIIARLKALEAAGLKQIALQVLGNGREMIEEFSRDVIARY